MGLYLWDRIHQYTGVLFPSSDPATITKSIETQTVYSSSRQVQTVLNSPTPYITLGNMHVGGR